jgi:hypothetical protein
MPMVKQLKLRVIARRCHAGMSETSLQRARGSARPGIESRRHDPLNLRLATSSRRGELKAPVFTTRPFSIVNDSFEAGLEK